MSLPTWIDEASEFLTWLTILSILIGGLGYLGRRYTTWLRDVIKDEIASHTALIQPTSNGGRSLPDVAKKLDIVMAHLGIDDNH